jgi:selenide,water dikinase
MGGRVVLAVNIAAFPEELPTDVIAAIFAAASATVLEAGGTIAGGHTIRNPEPIFGLAVQGIVDPKHIFRKSGAQVGDIAILSKPLGTGLVTAAGTDADKKVAIAGMRTLNRAAAEQLREHQDHVHAVTDVTGYGLAGHGWEIAERSGVTLVVDTSALPLYRGALDIARSGHRTGGDPRNRLYVGDHLTATADDAHVALCMDPQTSGGLLAAVPQAIADALVSSGAWTAVGHFAAGGPALEIH